MNAQAVVERMEQPEAVTGTALTPMDMVGRAVASGASIEVVEKLMALHERWEANQGRKAFDEAMAAAKAEKARVAELEHALALARAFRFPDYPVPTPMTYEEIKASLVDGGLRSGRHQQVARGWFCLANLGGYGGYSNNITYGCSDGLSHGRDTDTTTSQGMGCMYRTRDEAAMALRHELTTQCAEVLARVDQMLAEPT